MINNEFWYIQAKKKYLKFWNHDLWLICCINVSGLKCPFFSLKINNYLKYILIKDKKINQFIIYNENFFG